jgi:hypothetical protein
VKADNHFSHWMEGPDLVQSSPGGDTRLSIVLWRARSPSGPLLLRLLRAIRVGRRSLQRGATFGPVVHLEERLHGMQEAEGSNPFGSTGNTCVVTLPRPLARADDYDYRFSTKGDLEG